MKYKLLKKPLTKAGKDNWVKGVIAVELSEIVPSCAEDFASSTYEQFLDMLAIRLVGDDLLMGIEYRVVGQKGDTLHLEVQGDASESFNRD